jgi:NADPH-dependent 2,4-dienoyl-CoA reductase/sulfur reductase-like enzyme/nitrite reductase/ring-hydroxylating ferredoxin subunit
MEDVMSSEEPALSGPDFTLGVPLASLPDGAMLQGSAHGEAVLLVRRGDETFAVGALCSHYHAPLADGLLDGDTVHCPWHHACFSLRTGEALHAPAFDALPRWRVEQREGMLYVREKLDAPRRPAPGRSNHPASVTIIGGGAAGFAAAEMLRREGYAGPVVMFSADAAPPCDRPNLSKDFLAGTAPEEWLPLRPDSFYAENSIDLRLGVRVEAIHTSSRTITLASGEERPYDALLLATGAEPVRLSIPGSDAPHVHYLRTLADSRAIIADAASARKAVVIGASFIGLEVAASLRTRKLEVHVVAPEGRPMERILGAELGAMTRAIHEEHGVIFHLGSTVASIDAAGVMLASGDRIAADLVVVGIGVRPCTTLAEEAGLAVDHGVLVNTYLQTSSPGIYAAGDIARWPSPFTGERIRVEHWAVAQRQGQTAARNMLGWREPFTAIPFFWSQHYDATIAYVGHAEKWDHLSSEGSPSDHDCAVTYWLGGVRRAIATVGRDIENLTAEVEFGSPAS